MIFYQKENQWKLQLWQCPYFLFVPRGLNAHCRVNSVLISDLMYPGNFGRIHTMLCCRL